MVSSYSFLYTVTILNVFPIGLPCGCDQSNSHIDEAEKRLSLLEGKILSLESNSVDMLQAKGDIEEIVKKMQTQGSINNESKGLSVNDMLITTLVKERDEAIKENQLLKKEVEQLNYRVQHLIKSLIAEESKK